MIQFVVPGALPTFPALRSRCLANPDALLKVMRETGESACPDGDPSDRFSLILHDLRMAGVWKRTNRGRLKRTEEMLCAHIAPGLRHEFNLLDVGASDGITTVEALRALRQNFGGQPHAFLNRCSHVAMELDFQPDRFFDDTGQWLLCATHGAVYRPDTGECAGGPCRGGLVKIALSEHDGVVHWHTDWNLHPLTF